MTSTNKSAVIALTLVATNWHWSYTTRSTTGTSSEHIDGPTIGLLIMGIALVIWLVRLFRIFRLIGAKSVNVPESTKLFSWYPVIVLLPLFYSAQSSATTTSGDIVTTVSHGYGCEASRALFVVAAAAIFACQASSTLQQIYANAERD